MLFLQQLPFLCLSIQHKDSSPTYRDGWASHPSMPLNLAEAGLTCFKKKERFIPIAVIYQAFSLSLSAFLGFSSCLSSPHFRLFCDFSSQSTSTLVRPCLHVLLSLTAYKTSDLWSFGGWIPGFLLHPYLCCCFDSRLSVSVTLHLLSAPSSSPSFHDSIGVKLPHLPKMRILCIPEQEDFLSDYLLELKIAI